MAFVDKRHPHVVILHRVPYRAYARLTGVSDNRHLKMAYHDGTLEILSLRLFRHESASNRLGLVVTTVAQRLGVAYHGAGGTTFRRCGDGPFRGKGREPDASFYIASIGRLPLDREVDLDGGDPPPDLWIEVDGRLSSAGRLPVYASLGVPEVWRYRARRRTLRFLRLVGDSYEPIERSLALPALTPTLVLEALAFGEDLIDSEWARLLRAWVSRTLPLPEAGA
jgi:Uma2 family endonuclease